MELPRACWRRSWYPRAIVISMLVFLLPVAALFGGVLYARRRCLRRTPKVHDEVAETSRWRAQLSRGDLVQFRLVSGRIIDDAEIVMVESGRQRALVSSESDHKAWVDLDSLYPPSYVFE